MQHFYSDSLKTMHNFFSNAVKSISCSFQWNKLLYSVKHHMLIWFLIGPLTERSMNCWFTSLFGCFEPRFFYSFSFSCDVHLCHGGSEWQRNNFNLFLFVKYRLWHMGNSVNKTNWLELLPSIENDSIFFPCRPLHKCIWIRFFCITECSFLSQCKVANCHVKEKREKISVQLSDFSVCFFSHTHIQTQNIICFQSESARNDS